MRILSSSLLLFALLAIGSSLRAQVLTKEDSLNAGLIASRNATVVSGYGEMKVNYDLRFGTGTANLTRNVVFMGHRFSDKVYLFSETELENAKVTSSSIGEISMEQLFLKFNAHRNFYLVGGLFIPRLGIINENHLPTTFNGNDRPFVEQMVLPSTWRELGVGIYAQIPSVPGLNLSAALVNGLNSAGFTHGSGIRDGRAEGSNASASNLAVTGALLYYTGQWRLQASSYYGGSAGLSAKQADSLRLDYGAFGTPVSVSEVNAQYNGLRGFECKLLGTLIRIPDAGRINRAYASNTPEGMYGWYAEIGFNLLRNSTLTTGKKFLLFARYEQMDLNAQLPENGLRDDWMKKQFLITGFTWQVARGASVKLDYVWRKTGDYNKSLYVTNPYSTTLPFYKQSNFINLGVAYSF